MNLQALSDITGVPVRAIKRYIDLKLVQPPIGRTRAAVYDDSHRADVMRVQAFRAAGWGYERIRDEMRTAQLQDDGHSSHPGGMTVEHRFRVAAGTSLVFESSGARADTERWRRLAQRVEEFMATLDLE